MKIAVIDDERPARKMLIRRVKEVRPPMAMGMVIRR